MQNVQNLDSVTIGGEVFRGIGWQGLLTVNTKTYVEEPTRANDGSMANLYDHDTFIVPRCQVNFKYFKIEDYQRLVRVINNSNEFPVTYWDKHLGKFVTYNMYCEPEEMAKLFNVGTSVFGVLDYTVSFIGTRNNLQEYSVTYNLNAVADDSSTLSTTNYTWGSAFRVMTGGEVSTIATEKGYTLPSGKVFAGWNTLRNGAGYTYYPNYKSSIFEDLVLYAQWENSQS